MEDASPHQSHHTAIQPKAEIMECDYAGISLTT